MFEFCLKLALEFLKQPYIILFFIIVIFLFIYKKKIIGKVGEFWVNLELKKLDKTKYYVINDFMFRTSDNVTHQIDNIIISKYGIFVIEVKQYNGYITGNDYDKMWVIKAGKTRYNIYNPTHQNYGHIKALCEVLNIDVDKFINIVCISSNATINVDSKNTISINKLLKKIYNYKEIILNNEDDVYKYLNSINIDDMNVRKEHVNNIKNIKEKNTDNLCPKCGGKLVKRNSQYGSFYGCSNYPKCKYIKK